MPKKHYITLAAALLSLSSLSTAFAGTETVSSGKESKPVATPCPVTYITGDFGVTFTSEYDSRGIPQPDQWKGVIAQPYLDLYIKLYSGDANSWGINSVSAQLSFWSDIGSNHSTSPAGSTTPYWEEFDWMPGLSMTFAQKFTLTVQYFEFDSPADVFSTARSINANLTYDDSSLLGPFALHPHVTVLYELGSNGWAGLHPHGWYYEFGIAPSYTFMPKSQYPITLSAPFTLGLGSGGGGTGFYGNNNFGYFSVGPNISVPLAFIPSGFGSWTLSAAYTYYYEGTTIREAIGPPVGSGANSRNVFSGALGCTF
ncbi:MAG TPA: hypothetical protein VHY22_09955 [Chthoniobacteraceae bacterium]|jgi:hypothetical protein|nr:hypothetical protein [Chthoniobacteraceae bacterium]